MIKVIASDMDGTLLNEKHALSQRTLEAIHKAQEAGIRFMIATGRNFKQTLMALGDIDLQCDFLVGSGAEVRNPQKEILHSSFMSLEKCRAVYEVMRKYEVAYSFSAGEVDYCFGEADGSEDQVLEQMSAFHKGITKEELKKNEIFQVMIEKTRMVPDFDTMAGLNPKITKIFAFSSEIELLDRIKEELEETEGIAISSSFPSNLEITDISAQKGPVLKAYIEKLGYTMDEVMVFGDSLNDYSMLSMDFGATIAMENAHPDIKRVAKYITKSNVEDGVAYVIEQLLAKEGY